MDKIELDDFVDFYKREYNIGADRRYSNRELWKLKAYAYCVTHYLGYSVSKAAKALHKHHTTLLHHLKRMDAPDYIHADDMLLKYVRQDIVRAAYEYMKLQRYMGSKKA